MVTRTFGKLQSAPLRPTIKTSVVVVDNTYCSSAQPLNFNILWFSEAAMKFFSLYDRLRKKTDDGVQLSSYPYLKNVDILVSFTSNF